MKTLNLSKFFFVKVAEHFCFIPHGYKYPVRKPSTVCASLLLCNCFNLLCTVHIDSVVGCVDTVASWRWPSWPGSLHRFTASALSVKTGSCYQPARPRLMPPTSQFPAAKPLLCHSEVCEQNCVNFAVGFTRWRFTLLTHKLLHYCHYVAYTYINIT